MPSILATNALTTSTRVGERLIFSPNATQITLLENFINACTSYIEGRTSRRFLHQKYTNEIYSFVDGIRTMVALRHAPVTFGVISMNLISGSTSASIDVTTDTMMLQAGMKLFGDGVPPGTTISSIFRSGGSTFISMSAKATMTAASTPVYFNGLVSCQYRAGTPSTPSWTDFIQDQYELMSDGKSGCVRVYGNLFGINNFRVSYWSGYVIDFANINDPVKHNLPFELTDLCERLVVRAYKKREAEAEKSVGGPQSTVTWADFLDDRDNEVLDRYTRTIFA